VSTTGPSTVRLADDGGRVVGGAVRGGDVVGDAPFPESAVFGSAVGGAVVADAADRVATLVSMTRWA
jgi:hypothetical protein